MSDDSSRELDRAIDSFLDRVGDLDVVPELPDHARSAGPGARHGNFDGAGPGNRHGDFDGAGPGTRRGDFDGAGPGTRRGDFEIVRELGRGAAGVVYEARQLSVSGRRVALKVLHAAGLGARARERFAREISVAGRLDHPAIVPVVAADLAAEPPWLAMRLVPGRSAGALVERLRRDDLPRDAAGAIARALGAAAPPTPASFLEGTYAEWVARVGLELAEALAHAHAAGVLHRDVKPWNVIVTPEGRPVLVDLGLARDESEVGLTRPGAFVGTLAYSPPEQLRGEPLDARVDVYGLGATLYELLELRRPFDAPTRAALVELLEEETRPSFGTATPEDLRTVVECALSSRAGDRYPDAGEMARDLRAFLAGEPIRARPPGLRRRARAFLRRHRRLLGAALVLLVVLATRQIFVEREARALMRRGAAAQEEALRARERWRARKDAARGTLVGGLPAAESSILREELALAAAREQTASDRAEAHLVHASELPALAAREARRRLGRLLAFRMRSALERFEDVLDPEGLGALEGRLRMASLAGDDARLLDRRGRAAIATRPPGARLTLRDASGRAVLTTTTPARLDGLAEGCWYAELAAEGHAPARYPFLVRRDACYEDGAGLPPRDHEVRLVPLDEIPGRGAERGPRDWTYVPGGWTLVEDAPPTWIRLDDFFLMTDEATYADWLEFAGSAVFREARARGESLHLPRFSEEAVHIDLEAAGGSAFSGRYFGPDVAPERRGEVPVHGLLREEMRRFAQSIPDPPRGWSYGLPTRDEWIRAARGADGRRYPWGDRFDWSHALGYHSRALLRRDRWPLALDTDTRDVSPFGIRRLSGSVAEICDEDVEPARARVVVVGGSFATARAERMGVLAAREEPNDLLVDVGVRAVMRRIPSWARGEDGVALPFSDDFRRPDGPSPGGAWAEVVDWPPLPTRPVGPFDWVSIEGGRLRLRGGEGQGSRAAMALLPLAPGSTPSRLEAEVLMSCRGAHRRMLGRGFGVSLVRDPLTPEETALSFHWTGGDEDEVLLRCGPRQTLASSTPSLRDRPALLEISIDGARVEARLWDREGPRPEEPTVSLEIEDEVFRADLLQLRADNLVGPEAEIARVALR